MSGWDFWNNPLVVSAMRLKYRRGSPGLSSSIYALALLGVASVLSYVSEDLPIPFGRAYLLAILSIQFALSGGIALISVSSSMSAEVVNRTLDFQRIVSLSPRAIMLGKMIGEPAAAYFFALTTIPFAVICWRLGGASGSVIVAMYVNLASFILLCAALGLMHTLAPVESSAQKRRGSFAGIFVMAFFLLPSFLSRGHALLDNPWTGTPLGLLTPIAALVRLAEGNAWSATVPLWGARIPARAAAPLCQLALASWIMAAMARRLRSTNAPPVTWRRAWGALALFDALAASICYAQLGASQLLAQRTAQFCIAHLLACTLLTITTTPSREGLMANIWRFRRDGAGWSPGRGERAENTWLLLGMAAVGGAAWALGFMVPALLGGYAQVGDPSFVVSLRHISAMMVWLLTLGTCYQLILVMCGKSGAVWAFLLLAAVNVAPPVTASILEGGRQSARGQSGAADAILGLSPIAYFVTNQGRWTQAEVGSGLPLVVYGIAGMASYRGLQRWIDRRKRHVAEKLRAMGCATNYASPAS